MVWSQFVLNLWKMFDIFKQDFLIKIWLWINYNLWFFWNFHLKSFKICGKFKLKAPFIFIRISIPANPLLLIKHSSGKFMSSRSNPICNLIAKNHSTSISAPWIIYSTTFHLTVIINYYFPPNILLFEKFPTKNTRIKSNFYNFQSNRT